MKGHELLTILGECLVGDELFVCCNGNLSRQAFHTLPRPQIYLRGSMGLSIPVGLGLAIAQPSRKVIVITGDGNLLMGLGAAATVGAVKPSNLGIIIVDNQMYATTGGQPNCSSVMNFPKFLVGCGFQQIETIKDDLRPMVEQKLSRFLRSQRMAALYARVQEEPTGLPNISWHPQQITSAFRRALGLGL